MLAKVWLPSAVRLALQVVQVEEPGEEEAVEWLRGLAPRYGQHHGVVFTEGALRAAARCARRCVGWGSGWWRGSMGQRVAAMPQDHIRRALGRLQEQK